MADAWLLSLGVLLPLFPLSMIFNLVFARAGRAWQRGLLVLLWPQLGIVLLTLTASQVPGWMQAWALLTSALYAFRALVLRDMTLWIGFLASSTWALLWVAAGNADVGARLHVYALAFSAPLLLLVLLVSGLEQRFGAAYTGLYGGLAQSLPRFSVALVLAVLAAIATPLFPAFFAMLNIMVATIRDAPLQSVALAVIWLVWSWAGIRLLQGLVAGPPGTGSPPDLSLRSTSAYAGVLAGLVVAGLYMAGGLA